MHKTAKRPQKGTWESKVKFRALRTGAWKVFQVSRSLSFQVAQRGWGLPSIKLQGESESVEVSEALGT